MNRVYLIEVAHTAYRAAWSLQRELFDYANKNQNTHFLVLTEHDPVITIGRTGTLKNLLVPAEYLAQQAIDLVEIDRGGDITFHGPGQIVGYPILDLNGFKRDVHWYLRTLEDVIIGTLQTFDIDAGRIPGLTGVWTGGRKICAMGIKVTRWVTMHGFALNVNTDLGFFKHIIPCGITDRGVTSISELTGNIVDINQVIKEVVGQFEQVFKVRCIAAPHSLYHTIPTLRKMQEQQND